ncbi:type-2 angiotensin II receptor-like [Lineus longissimus]|uniref:type-2 angiotensin II receptor-like n=1 Tax=Lineus longissimus TaxID=88925 RepID=UPI002B4F3FD9
MADVTTIASDTSNATDSYKTYTEFKVANYVKIVWCIIIIPMGTAGNVLSFMIMRSKEMRKSTTSFYLSVLAVSDCCVIYLAALPELIFTIIGTPRYDYNDITCTVLNYAEFITTDISSWILVVVSFERLLAAWFPFHAKRICSIRIAYIACLLIALSLAAVNSQLLVLKGRDESGVCGPKPQFRDYWANVWLTWDMCNFSILPMCTMSVCNLSVLLKLKMNKSWQEKRKSTAQGDGKKKVSSNTIIMMTINIAFFSTTFPSVLFQVLVPNWIETKGHNRAQYELIWAFLLMLSFTNSAINFLLYCLSGPRFRKELRSILGIATRTATVGPESNTANTRVNHKTKPQPTSEVSG